jgi:Vitamin K-dependent gamma-carboxylase
VIDRWLMAPAPAARLAMFRVMIGVFSAGYLVARLPTLLALGGEAPIGWKSVGVLWWLADPLPSWVLRCAVLATIAFAVAYAAGAAFRIVGPAFAIALLFITTYRSSGGQLLWFDNLLVLHAIVIACSPAGDALRLGRRRAAIGQSARYGWPLRVAAIVTVVTYALAGISKLRVGRTAWLDGESLRNHVAYSATRLRVLGGTPSPLAEPMIELGWLLTPLAVATLVIELGAPLALVVSRLRVLWVASVWCMHAAIAATMFVVFPYPLALIAFAPLFRLERLLPGLAECGDRSL